VVVQSLPLPEQPAPQQRPPRQTPEAHSAPSTQVAPALFLPPQVLVVASSQNWLALLQQLLVEVRVPHAV
jgi:hypothetical protein